MNFSNLFNSLFGNQPSRRRSPRSGLPSADQLENRALLSATNVAADVSVEPLRHGADDPAGDDHGRRHGGHGADDTSVSTNSAVVSISRRGGNDDPAGHEKHHGKHHK